MTLAAPLYLAAALAAAAVVVALHLISTRRPPSVAFPTARFIPDAPSAATARRASPSDLALLALRVLVLLLAGLALARPSLVPPRRALARVALVDVSRAAGGAGAARARAMAADADTVIAFDSLARGVSAASLDSLLARGARAPRGSLSAGLVAAVRAGARLAPRTDSLELVLVSPLLAEELDRATLAIRDRWPGRIRVERTAPTPSGERGASTGASGQLGPRSPERGARSGAPNVDDRAPRADGREPRAEQAPRAESREPRASVTWADSAPTPLWRPRARPDTVGAVVAGDVVLVASLARRWEAAPLASGTRIVARWPDGEPAALERATDAGCERTIGWSMPTAGDVALRGDAERMLSRLTVAPCGDPYDATSARASDVARLAGNGRIAASSDFPAVAATRSRLPAVLLLIALALALAELAARRAGAPMNSRGPLVGGAASREDAA